jgi:cephalosporin hydroxylase
MIHSPATEGDTVTATSGPGLLRQTARPMLRRGLRAAEAGVVAAFVALVERQARVGRLTPRVEQAIADALRHVATTSKGRARTGSPAVRELVNQFHRLCYDDGQTWRKNTWQGRRTWKSPNDLWLYQEIIHALRPGLVIETGTAFGGSATYMGFLLDLEQKGRVVSVDIASRATPPHPRVTYIAGSSTDPAVVEQVRSMVEPAEPVLVILDSDHSERHVYDELRTYADLVTVGSYVIVEDTNVNGHPAHPQHGPGPMEAVQRFLAERSDFVVDERMHRWHFTLNPRGYLRRIG